MLSDLPEKECHGSVPFKIEGWKSVELRWACRMRTGNKSAEQLQTV
jgi:hypothetical protein